MNDPISGAAAKRATVTVFYEGRRIMRSGVRALRNNCVWLDPGEPGQHALLPHMVVGIEVEAEPGASAVSDSMRLPAVVLTVGETGIELELECPERTVMKVFELPFGEDHARP
ncbi:MAG: hypothetical protein GTO67_13865 [Gammaproteobacteria bacterium]|nr:hypothetical protein [Gammaproteobacteria bacterium]NIN39655.1 hypothetical protein [Gammaproteobacteria bacterium]NIO25212.1 hypothetical protein [Gammaproteobacteria bacterium]NIO65841.1 hypothetical protein [Gammaproteobacteria bacterium]NIP45723.1 hypothetical protein [Gammaproteobacteria bacterium]